MAHNILLTGVSGYLGGDLLTRLTSADSPIPKSKYKTLYCLVRTDSQATSVRNYGATPLTIDITSPQEVRSTLIEHEITIVFFLVDALRADNQGHFIDALAGVKSHLLEKKGVAPEVHFLHTSGAKIFSSHAGAPTQSPLYDNAHNLYDIQKGQKPVVPLLQSAIDANNTVIERAEAMGVKSYIFVPCIVYGEGHGFGNKISIQTVAIVKAARAAKRVYSVDEGRPGWPVCHVEDNSMLYIKLLSKILEGREDIGTGGNGYFLASPGSVVWEDLYRAMARRLKERGVVEDGEVRFVSSADGSDGQEILKRMGKGIGCPPELVSLQLGGRCTFTARHGEESLGWKPHFKPEHILESAAEEVDLILKHL